MVLTDPREIFCGFLRPGATDAIIAGNLTREDGSNAFYTSYYDFAKTTVEEIFVKYGYDIAFIIHVPPFKPYDTGSGPIGYIYNVGIEVCTIDKRASASAMKIVGHKLLWQGVSEVLRILRVNADGSFREVKQGLATSMKMGSSVLYAMIVEAEYIQDVTAY